VKTATWRILTFSIWIGMLAGTQLLAQQTIRDKSSSHSTLSKTVYVAQQQETTDQSGTDSTTSQPSQNSTPQNSTPTTTTIQPSQNPTPTPAAASQTQQSNSAPGTLYPGLVPSDQNPVAMPDNMAGVENGLWDGAEPGNCCAICGGGYCTPPCWYVEQGVEIMTHSRPRDAGITYQGAYSYTYNSSGDIIASQYILSPFASTHDANYNIAPGYNATIGRYLGRDAMDRDDFLEFTYWGMNTWTAALTFDPGTGLIDGNSVSVVGQKLYNTGALNTPFLADSYSRYSGSPTRVPTYFQLGVVGFDSTEIHHFTMDSEMHNFELNLRLRPRGRPDQLVLNPDGRWQRECQPGTYLSYLVGLRYMTVGEGFHFQSRGSITRTTLATYDPTTGAKTYQQQPEDIGYIRDVSGAYDVLTENDLLGLQIGADLMFRRCKWAWGVRAKAGPYVNFARNVKDLYNDPQDVPSLAAFNNRFSERRQVAALIGEVGFEATYKFKPNLMGRAAYDFRWITGLALGSEQLSWSLDPGTNDTINTGGTIYSHGLTLDLEWFW